MKRLSVIGLSVLASFLVAGSVQATLISLNSAGPTNWELLAVGNGTDGGSITIGTGDSVTSASVPPAAVGLVGPSTGLELTMSGTGLIQGPVDMGNNGTINIASTNSIGGGIYGLSLAGSKYGNTYTNVSEATVLNAARAAALSANAAATALPTSSAFAGITSINLSTSSETLTGTAGENVLNLTNLNISGNQVLTLDAPAGSQFILNVSNQFSLDSGTIAVGGGLNFSNVIVNLAPGAQAVDLTDCQKPKPNPFCMTGIVLAPYQCAQLSYGTLYGELIAENISLCTCGNVQMPCPPGSPGGVVPEPTTVALLGLGLVGVLARRRTTKG
jgi:hypothetical protein